MASQRQKLPQVGPGCTHRLWPVSQLGLVRARLLFGEGNVWGAADVGFGRLHCGGAYASLQQASNWLRSVGSGVLYSPGIWPLYDILLLQLRNIFSHPRFVNWNIPIFHRNSTGIFQYSTGIPLEYSDIPLEYSMESHIPLEYLVEF